MANCGICGREMRGEWADPIWPDDVASVDCAGHCLQCMADCGDPDAIAVLKEKAERIAHQIKIMRDILDRDAELFRRLADL
jgi:hypothetical protein